MWDSRFYTPEWCVDCGLRYGKQVTDEDTLCEWCEADRLAAYFDAILVDGEVS